jgi:hypothetical protein
MVSVIKRLAFAATFAPPYSAVAFLSLVPFMIATMGDAPMTNPLNGLLLISYGIIGVGYTIASVIEYFVIKHVFTTLPTKHILLTILFSWIIGPLYLAILLFLFWFMMGGLPQLIHYFIK